MFLRNKTLYSILIAQVLIFLFLFYSYISAIIDESQTGSWALIGTATLIIFIGVPVGLFAIIIGIFAVIKAANGKALGIANILLPVILILLFNLIPHSSFERLAGHVEPLLTGKRSIQNRYENISLKNLHISFLQNFFSSPQKITAFENGCLVVANQIIIPVDHIRSGFESESELEEIYKTARQDIIGKDIKASLEELNSYEPNQPDLYCKNIRSELHIESPVVNGVTIGELDIHNLFIDGVIVYDWLRFHSADLKENTVEVK